MAFGLVFGLVSAARLDGKSGRQRASSAHPFENRKRMRHPLLRYRKQENQEAVKAAPPVDPEPSCNITANYAGEGFVHFVASDSYGCSRSSDSTQVDAYAIPTAETTSPSGETYDQVTGNSEDRFQAGFIQTLSDAASDSFSTLVVQEQSGGDPNLLDLCHFTGSAFDPYDLSGVNGPSVETTLLKQIGSASSIRP